MVTHTVYNAFGTDVSREDWLENLSDLHVGTFGTLEQAERAIRELHENTGENYGVEADPNGWQEVEPGAWHLDCYEADTGNQLAGFYEIKRVVVTM